MASVLTELAKAYVVKLIDGQRYICCFTDIANDFEEERARLEIESTSVKQRVDVFTNRGEDVQSNALYWEEEAAKLIQEDTKTKQICLFGFCPHIIWRYKRGKELTNKKEQIKRLIQTGKELSIGLPARLPVVELYSSRHYISFESRYFQYIELLNALKDDINYVIGLTGMGGTGKTTLAKEVGKVLKESKQFACVIDTTVSSSVDIRKIQNDIAGPLGLDFNDCSESDRPKKLWSRLSNGEKILLILDDVQEDINFGEIGFPDIDNRKGCRILLTTRNKHVWFNLCCKIIELELLSDKDVWIMFKWYAGLSENSNKNLLEKGRKISKECKKLPIAIAAIARSLKDIQHPKVWDVTLNSLQKHISMNSSDDELPYDCLQVSYDNMKNEKSRRLFLLCSLFRADEQIPIERVTRLGIGGGLFGEDYGSYNDARNQVIGTTNILLYYCLLLEADQRRVKMHDLVREAAQRIANNDIQTVKLYDKNQKAMIESKTNIKYLLCEGKLNDVLSFKLDGSKLEILIVSVNKDDDCHNMKIEFPNSFLKNSTDLRVFHLIYDHYSKITLSSPQSIQSLKNIRSLLITLGDLGDISTLGNLKSLETLDLKDCNIDELPHGIAKLEKFRLLNLESCGIVWNNPFEVIARCSSLEELYFTGSFNAFCHEINFPKLRRFCIDEYRRSVNDSSSKYVSVVDKGEVLLSETTLKYYRETAEVLRLRSTRGSRNRKPKIVSIDQCMNSIFELSLSCISQLQYLIDTKHTGFQVPIVLSMLVVLKLDRMENLEELFNGPISLDSLKNLEKLSIKDCKHLQSLFKCKLNLCSLKTIILQNCPMLASMFQSLTSRSLGLLEKLQIANCERLENIIRDGLDNEDMSPCSMFPNLKVFNIEECPRLESMLPFLSAQELPVLEAINLRSCDGLKYIFCQYNSMFLYRLHICEHIKCLPIQSYSICHVKEINLSHFSKIKSVFILSITPKMLLETLTIKNCHELKNIIIDIDHESGVNNWGDVFPKLQRIYVEDCNKLEYIFGRNDLNPQSHDEIHLNLPVLKYINLCNLPGLVAMCTKQYRTTFPPLGELEHSGCSPAAIKSFHDLESLDTIKKGIQISVEDGTASANTETITSSHHSKPEDDDGQRAIASPPIAITKPVTPQDVDVKIWQETSKTNDEKGDLSQIDEELEHGDDQLTMTSFSIATTETNDQVSPKDDAFNKVISNIEEQFPKDDDIVVSKSSPSSIASQCPSKPSEGDPSQIDEDLSSSLVVTKELENLVSKNHLAIENLSLLIDFLVKHPSVLVRDPSLSNRYKGYAYNCLAELLKFLQTHSVLDVLGSSNSEFVELLQDVRSFAFDKDWLDCVEKRALFPGLQISHQALQKLLDSKHILNEHVKHQLASSKAVLDSIIQQEAHILQTQATLSDPIGY